MAERDTNNFLHILEAPGSVENLKLFRLSGDERISQPFRFRLQLRSHGEVPPASAWINASITFAIGTSDMDEARRINGRCTKFEHIHQKGSYVEFAIEVAPAFEALTLTRDRRLFTDKSARQVVGEILGEHRVAFDDAKYGPSPTRPYIVQSDESDFAFVSRLLEDEGVFYFFKFDEGAAPYKHRMMMAGDTSGYYDGKPFETSFRRDHLLRGLHDLQMGYASAPAKVLTHDYDFQKPGSLSPVTAPSKLDWAAPSGQVYRYAEDYTDGGRGKERADLRIQREEAGAVTMKGEGSYVAFAPAARFNVDDPRLDPRERRIVVRSVSHEAFDPYGRDEGDPEYRQSFEAQPSTQVFRPERSTPRAQSRGPQTAVVLDQNDPEGFGRIKVKFHWDRTGASTAWVRVLQQWAGSEMGAQFVPRPGMEVLVDFIEGRLDRPVVVGCLYNGQNKHSFAVPGNLSQTGFRTFGDGGLVHELFFEDKGGAERVYLRSGRDFARDVARNESAHVKELSETTIGTTSRTFSTGKMLIESAEAITIKVGASKITIDQGGVWIDAPKINLNSPGAPDHDVPAVTQAGQAAAAGAAAAQAKAAAAQKAAAAPPASNQNAGKAGVGGAGGAGGGAGAGGKTSPSGLVSPETLAADAALAPGAPAPISPEERRYADEGRRRDFWRSRLERGDPMAQTALEIVDSSSFRGYTANMRLRNGLRERDWNPFSNYEDEVEQVGRGLMDEHVKAVDVNGSPSPRQIALYHHKVFADHDLGPTMFGGTMLTGDPGEANYYDNLWMDKG